ncbi:MAG: hypothetical protein ACXVCK_20930 [Bdellovibrionota bacterium]
METELIRLAAKFHIRVYSIATAHDHLHFVARLLSRAHYVKFIRARCGLVARKLGTKLWAELPFSRVGTWGRDFKQLLVYLKKNCEEANGERPYEIRNDWYKRYRGKPG